MGLTVEKIREIIESNSEMKECKVPSCAGGSPSLKGGFYATPQWSPSNGYFFTERKMVINYKKVLKEINEVK